MVHSTHAGNDLRKRIEQAVTLAVEKELPQKGTKIALGEAARKYGISRQTVKNWADAELVTILEPGLGQGSRCYVDEHDVALIVYAKVNRVGVANTT